jgi:3-oxoacyl-ACP reductase-like protein
MLTRDNVLVGDDPNQVTFERDGVYTDRKTGKPVAVSRWHAGRDP